MTATYTKSLGIYSDKAWKMLFLAKHNLFHFHNSSHTFARYACNSILDNAEDGEIIFSSECSWWEMRKYSDKALRAKTGLLIKDEIFNYIFTDSDQSRFFANGKIDKYSEIEIDHCTDAVKKTLDRLFFSFDRPEQYATCSNSYHNDWCKFAKVFSVDEITAVQEALTAKEYDKALRMYFNNDMPKVCDYFILFDWLVGNSKKNMCKHYGNEAVDRLIGSARNQFVVCQQKAMEDMLFELQNNFENERLKLENEQKNEVEKLTEKYDKMQIELRKQFAEKKNEVVASFKAMAAC